MFESVISLFHHPVCVIMYTPERPVLRLYVPVIMAAVNPLLSGDHVGVDVGMVPEYLSLVMTGDGVIVLT